METFNIDLDHDLETSLSTEPPTPQALVEAMVVSEPPSKRRRESKRHAAVVQSLSQLPAKPNTELPTKPNTVVGAEAPMSQNYTTGADPNAVLNMEFEKFRRRIKKNLFRLQPVFSLCPKVEPLLKDLFTIIYSFIRGKKTKNLDQLLSTIGYPGLTEDDLGQKRALGDVLVKLIEFNETGTYAVPILLPIFIDNLFKGENLKFPAVSMTYFLINESLPIENSGAVLRLIAYLAEMPEEFIDALDKGFRFTANVLDNIKKIV